MLAVKLCRGWSSDEASGDWMYDRDVGEVKMRDGEKKKDGEMERRCEM
jgi:hypothetical protein